MAKKNLRVLVTGAGGDVGQGVIKSLQNSNLRVEIFTTCINSNSGWLYKMENSFLAPPSASDEYLNWLVRFIKKFEIDFYFPAIDSEIYKISTAKRVIEAETNVNIFIDEINKVQICNDKYSTANFLKKNKFSHPITVIYDVKEADAFLGIHGFPMMLKKRVGRGGQDVHVIHNREQLNKLSPSSEYIIQEWLDPSMGEYTSGVYIGDDDEVKGICTFKRRLEGGSTVVAERVVNDELEWPLVEIAKKLGMKYINIQSMMSKGVLVPFEFNGRLSGTVAMVSRVFNAPEMFIRERFYGEKLTPIVNREEFTAMRYYEEVYCTPSEVKKLIDRSEKI